MRQSLAEPGVRLGSERTARRPADRPGNAQARAFRGGDRPFDLRESQAVFVAESKVCGGVGGCGRERVAHRDMGPDATYGTDGTRSRARTLATPTRVRQVERRSPAQRLLLIGPIRPMSRQATRSRQFPNASEVPRSPPPHQSGVEPPQSKTCGPQRFRSFHRANLRDHTRMKPALTFALVPLVLGLLFPAPRLLAEDWPQWRGPHRDGISAEKGLLQEWPKDGPKLLWQVKEIGAGFLTLEAPSATRSTSIATMAWTTNSCAGPAGRRWQADPGPCTSGRVGKSGAAAGVSSRPLHADGRWRSPLRAGLRRRSALPRDGHGEGSLEEKPALGFWRSGGHLGVCGVAARRWRCARLHTRRPGGRARRAEQEKR